MLNRQNLLLAFPILSLVWFAGTIIIAGLYYPGYSHITQFISELGATGSPHGGYVNFLGFIPTEIFILAFVFTCFLVAPKTKKNLIGFSFIVVYAVTLGISALYPCDFECRPVEPTISHNIHMLSAFPGYLCGVISIFILSSGSSPSGQLNVFKFVSFTVGGTCIYAFLNLDPNSPLVGVYQRSLDLMIYSWFIYFAYSLNQNVPNKTIKSDA
ncbi:Predicted membrane protein [Marinomonas sp. MED121]|uniref:DUF998 domain-containing protein n=1 Tax=Marinomonas sp. MED121 TaxID=314277 RepID=UPI0000690AB4|nr:DUF998 domain-containing protein [Marinomonas sp. MED121]EAQ66096.1 Predicted membrane protein [Marinomonas sp. MED121]